MHKSRKIFEIKDHAVQVTIKMQQKGSTAERKSCDKIADCYVYYEDNFKMVWVEMIFFKRILFSLFFLFLQWIQQMHNEG